MVRWRRGIHGGQGERGVGPGGQTGELWAHRDRSHTSSTGHQSLTVPQQGTNTCETSRCSVPVCSKATLHRGQVLASPPWGVCRTCRGEESRAPGGPFGRTNFPPIAHGDHFPHQRGFVVSVRLPTWHPTLTALSVPPLI